MTPRNEWSVSEDNKLKELWPNESPNYIATLIGRSRNAVIGRANRLELTKKQGGRPVNRKTNDPGRILAMKSVHRAISVALPRELPQYDTNPVSILEVQPYQCRAVLEGQADDCGLAIFCGKPITAGTNFRFCQEHLEVFTVKRIGR